VPTIKIDDLNPDACVELWYPSDSAPQTVTITLYHVCAADDLRVRFDFERNGYRISMDRTKAVPGGMDVVEEDAEVAFVPAWNEVDP
jgi:hypothetical protein